MTSKQRLYKAGSICMILLGILHTVYFIVSAINEEPVIYETLSNIIKKGAVWFLGERSLLSYYNGYSLSMGLLLISYGLLAIITERSTKSAILSTLVSFTAFIICVFYFHMLAYTLMGLSVLFYAFSLLIADKKNIDKQLKDKRI